MRRLWREIGAGWSFLRAKGLWGSLRDREAPLLLQFAKYGFCGVVSVSVFALVAAVGHGVAPEAFDLGLPAEERVLNLAILQLCGFIPANFSAYFLNRAFVFTPGRHNFSTELALFTLISLFSFGLGQVVPIWLIGAFNVANFIAHWSFVISSALVNFAARKCLVFAG